MYWPTGPARAYEQQIPSDSIFETTDGLADAQSPTSTNSPLKSPGSEPSESRTSRRRSSRRTRTTSTNETLRTGLEDDDGSIANLHVARNGHVFATITRKTVTVWLTKPTVILTSVVRSPKSLKTYGHNVGLLLRPDADLLVVQASLGFLITYAIVFDPDVRKYQLNFNDGGRHARRRSSFGPSVKYGQRAKGSLLEGGGEGQEARLHFRMVIRMDAGISRALALDHELVVITKDPPAVQCIRWSPDRSGAQFSTQLVDEMHWLEGRKTLAEMVYDKPMNLFVFLSDGGRAYAVQRFKDRQTPGQRPDALFDGHIFHIPENDSDIGVRAAINSRFSLVAVGCKDNSICVYVINNYAGGIILLRKIALGISTVSTGEMTTLKYSADGYCLFAGFQNGWATWSVYGQTGGTSFGTDIDQCNSNGDTWLASVFEASWVGGGSELLMTTPKSPLLWFQEFARSAVTSCFTPANLIKGLLQTSTGLVVYQGDQMTDMAAIKADASVWQHVNAPSQYIAEQWPIRTSVISPDGRYIAIAGQKGLVHYSINSGRWRTFHDIEERNEFSVRGGMCWHEHVLIASVETNIGGFEIRLYSRELPLESSRVLQTVVLNAPVVALSTSGTDGLLAYTYENTLDHFVIDLSQRTVKLVKVGQIALHGVIRAPPRVRAVSWIVPDHQLQQGEPSQDVASASVLFLVDGKLVLLQPSVADGGDLKYDMRIIASTIEYFMLSRDDPVVYASIVGDQSIARPDTSDLGLKDSIWAFDGESIKLWPDVRDFLTIASIEHSQILDAAITIPLDFYPITAALSKGLLIGTEAELVQRRDVNFSYFRTLARSSLYLPAVLRYYLVYYDISAALQLSTHFETLPYFSHALEILLHTVLDEEVDQPPTNAPPSKTPSTSGTPPPPPPLPSQVYSARAPSPMIAQTSTPSPSLLPTVLAFISNFPSYLDIILQCTRKTELRSWRTLFAHLPPPAQLFESALQAGSLKTAGGYLLLLQQSQESDITGSNATESDLSSITSPTSPTIAFPSNGIAPVSAGANAKSDRRFSVSSANATAHVFLVSQAVRLLRRAQKAGDWDLCKELARFLMALDDSGDVLRSSLEAAQRDVDEDEMYGDGGGNGEGLSGIVNGMGLVDLGTSPD